MSRLFRLLAERYLAPPRKDSPIPAVDMDRDKRQPLPHGEAELVGQSQT